MFLTNAPSTIIKTGVRLSYTGYDGHNHILYGDLHSVGNCAIIYYPPNQEPWQTSEPHGRLTDISLERFFQRDGSPYYIVVVEARFIWMTRDSLHPFDLAKWSAAGGRLQG
jgi:hypothetical protein